MKDDLNNMLNAATQALKGGGAIIIPTETVYGIAVDATNKLAIDKIYKIKNRDDAKPLQIMLANFNMAKQLAEFDEFANEFCQNNWPGSLTAILNMVDETAIAENFNRVDNSVGIRIPDHSLALKLIENFGSPLAVSSANISGQGDATNIASIAKEVLDAVDFVIDDGECESGLASTVIDFRTSPPSVLRKGSVKLTI